jgi:hypothetical protein
VYRISIVHCYIHIQMADLQIERISQNQLSEHQKQWMLTQRAILGTSLNDNNDSPNILNDLQTLFSEPKSIYIFSKNNSIPCAYLAGIENPEYVYVEQLVFVDTFDTNIKTILDKFKHEFNNKIFYATIKKNKMEMIDYFTKTVGMTSKADDQNELIGLYY